MSLSSERLIYKKCENTDLEDYLLFGMNEEVMRYVTQQALSRKDATERFERALVINAENTDLGYWFAYDKASGQLIAYLKLVYIGNGCHEIGYLLLPEHWGQQYATELTAMLVDYAKPLKEVTLLIGIVNIENGASKRVLLKQGFKYYKKGMLEGALAEFFRLEVG